MIIIKNDKLTHVDSSFDVLQHYGVKGMKWNNNSKGVEALTEEEKQLQYQGRLANLDGEYDKSVASLNKTIRTNGGKPVKYRSRMEDYAK